MEHLLAPEPLTTEPLSPPPETELGESVGSGAPNGSPAAPAAVQFASQASHLTLSAFGNDAERQRPGLHRMSTLASPTAPLITTCSMMPSSADAQLPPEIGPGEGVGEWQKGAAITHGQFLPDALPPSRSGSRPWEVDAGVDAACDVPKIASTMVAMKQSRQLLELPTEVLLQILSNLEVCDLLAISRTSHLLRSLALAPILHRLRLRRNRAVLPPLLTSPYRPSLADLIRRHIFLTNTTVVSRKLARNLVAICLQRRLAARPPPEVLVERCVLPPECVPHGYFVRGRVSSEGNGKGECGSGVPVAPALVAKRRAVERERVKDGLRRWVGSVWRGEVNERAEGVRRWEERAGVGRVWRLRRFWERVASEGGVGGR